MSVDDPELKEISEEGLNRDESRHDQRNIEIIQNYQAALAQLPVNPTEPYRKQLGNVNGEPIGYLEEIRQKQDGTIYRVVLAPMNKLSQMPTSDESQGSLGHEFALSRQEPFPEIGYGADSFGDFLELTWQPRGFEDPKTRKIYAKLPPELKSIIDFCQTILDKESIEYIARFSLGDLPTGGDLRKIMISGRQRDKYVYKDVDFDTKKGGVSHPWTSLTRNESSRYMAALLKTLPIQPVDQMIEQDDETDAQNWDKDLSKAS